MMTIMRRWIGSLMMLLSLAGCGESTSGENTAQAEKTMIRANNIILGGTTNIAMQQREGVKRITYRLWDKEGTTLWMEVTSDYDQSGALVREQQRVRRGEQLEPLYTIDRVEHGWQKQYLIDKDSNTAEIGLFTDQTGKIVKVRYGNSEDKLAKLSYDKQGNVIEVDMENPLGRQRSLYQYDKENRLIEVTSAISNKMIAISTSQKFHYGQDGKFDRIDYRQVMSDSDNVKKNEMTSVTTPQGYDQHGNWLAAKTSSYTNGEYRGETNKADYEIEYW